MALPLDPRPSQTFQLTRFGHMLVTHDDDPISKGSLRSRHRRRRLGRRAALWAGAIEKAALEKGSLTCRPAISSQV
jgi:hypothetical protein